METPSSKIKLQPPPTERSISNFIGSFVILFQVLYFAISCKTSSFADVENERELFKTMPVKTRIPTMAINLIFSIEFLQNEKDFFRFGARNRIEVAFIVSFNFPIKTDLILPHRTAFLLNART